MRLREVADLLVLAVLAVFVLGGAGAAGAGEPPLADAGLDQQVEQNATVLLDAAGSRDPDGSIRSYRWTIEAPDGRTIRPRDSDAPRTMFVARQVGRYEVTVTVTDDDGQTASDTLYVDVARTTAAPAAPTAPSDTTPGLPDDSSPSSDGVLDPAEPDAPLSAATESAGADRPPSSEVACRNGTARVGSLGCLQGEDPPAVVDISGPLYVKQGSAHTYTATVRDRPSGNERLSWSGGLGTGNTLSRVFTQPPGSTVRIAATVEDGEGHTSSDAIVVHVVTDNAPPEVRIEGPVAACVGEPVELEGYAIASEQHDEVVDSTWHGDPTFVPKHPGQYVVGFSARDQQSQTARTQHTVTVREERVCEPSNTKTSGGTTAADKLLIRATDDNLVEGSEVSQVMKARGKVPNEGPSEKLADVGAGLGRVGEGAAEYVTGNEDTLVFYMSAENASRLERNVRETDNDEVLAGANGPRINEHERLKNARVKDRVETEGGRIRVVVRIGKDNSGNPDRFTGDAQSDSGSAVEDDTPQETSSSRDKEAGSEELASSTEQTTVDNDPGVADTVSDITDTLEDAAESVGSAIDGASEDGSASQEPEPTTDDRLDSSTGDDSGSPSGSAIPGLDGIVNTAVDGSSGASADSPDPSDESILDGSEAWGGSL